MCGGGRTGGFVAIAGLAVTTLPAPALSASLLDSVFNLPERLDPHGAVGLAVFLGIVIFATTTALIHLGQRKRWTEREAALVAENEDLRARNDRADLLIASEPQIVVAWGGRGGDPEIEGDLGIVADLPVPRRVLAFGSWLPPGHAQPIEAAVDRLKARGESFRMTLRSLSGRMIEAEGRPVMGRAVLRVREISGDRLELLHTREKLGVAVREAESQRALMDAIPQPMWLRDAAGKLSWVNTAYVRAVEAPDATTTVDTGVEFLDRPVRDEAARSRARGTIYDARVPAVVAGQRRIFDVLEMESGEGAVGIATDVSAHEALRLELDRVNQNHAATLDHLPTAVAIFDSLKRLKFCNTAYRDLWQLDAGFLDGAPSDGEILDRLRNERRLPEQADWRSWKKTALEAYQLTEPRETQWYLPDGRSLRVVTNPNPDGGVTYLFDDVTEDFQLKTQVNAMMRVQGETLDTLKEGVAVFGTDGRLKLHNPAFADLWHLPAALIETRPHVDAVIAAARELVPDDETWNTIRGAVAGLNDTRRGFAARMERRDGTVLDCAAAPLPDGATLVTFIDMTATVNVERALTERNDALERAGQLRESFVHHVSYELRSPLTNVIGFTQLLADGMVGPLNERQKEYAGHIMRSSAALMAIIDDILDLATIDTGEIALSLGPVDIRSTVDAAAGGVQDRIAESRIGLVLDVPADIGGLQADGKRVRQVLFNLLSNAIGFSSPGQAVTLAVRRDGDTVVFRVSDSGRGIAPELLDKVFERFESHTGGSTHRGVGLGLSIVRSFVELHGGQVQIQSQPGQGTTVTCVFPADGVPMRAAAAA